MNNIDNFFKKKVEGLAIEPRPEAWSKLESNLSKKNKGLIWFRMAAAILFMGALTTSVIWMQKGKVSEQVAEQSKKEKPENVSGESKLKEGNVRQHASVNVEKNTGIVPKSNLEKQKLAETPEPEVIQNKPAAGLENLDPQIAALEALQPETVAAVTVVEKPIVIEYRLESVNYLKKETAVAETADKKNSLQKAIDFAREAKNSDSPLGGLRQAKDDLFALNFKKDKQKKH
jgi:hypothetical protein